MTEEQINAASDEFLARTFWGVQDHGGWTTYRKPLPPTSMFPREPRRAVIPAGITVPPYIVASEVDGVVEVMLTNGNGARANTAGVGWRDVDDVPYDQFICVGRDNVPEEWREPIGVALAEIRQHWPNKRLCFEPDSIPQPQE